jgi:hypothetical protein
MIQKIKWPKHHLQLLKYQKESPLRMPILIKIQDKKRSWAARNSTRMEARTKRKTVSLKVRSKVVNQVLFKEV